MLISFDYFCIINTTFNRVSTSSVILTIFFLNSHSFIIKFNRLGVRTKLYPLLYSLSHRLDSYVIYF